MYARPQLYLNGSAPFNVTGAAHACVYQLNESQHDPGVCTDAPDPDSYLWQVDLLCIVGGQDTDALEGVQQVGRASPGRTGKSRGGEGHLGRDSQTVGAVDHLAVVRVRRGSMH